MLPSDADLPEPAPRTPPEPKPTVPFRTPPRPSGVEAPPWRPVRPTVPPALDAGPDARALLKALGRRWLVATSLGLTCAAAAGLAVWFLLGARYTVFAQLRVSAIAPSMMPHTPGGGDSRDFNTYMRTAALALRSRFVLNAALKKDEVKRLRVVSEQAEPITWLEDELKVDYKEGSELLNVFMIGTDPDELVVLINAVTESYLTEVISQENKQKSDRLAELESIHEKGKEALRTRRENLSRRATDLGVSDAQTAGAKQLLLMTNLGDLRRQHGAVQFDLMKAQAKLSAFKNRTKAGPTAAEIEATISDSMLEDPKVKGLSTRITTLQRLVAEYEATAVLKTETALVRLRSQLDRAKKDLADRKAELKKDLVDRMQQKAKTESDTALAQCQDDINLLTEQEKTLKGQLQDLEKEAGKVGNSSVELEMARAEMKREEDALDKVGAEKEALKIELHSPPRISRYQEAAVQKKDMKKQIALTVVAPVAVLLGVCFVVAWLESRARRISTADEVVRGLGMRVVGAVPLLPDVLQLSLAADEADADGQSLLESVDAIRTLLLRDASLEKTRLVMVTSATDGEGKTALASHLAGSLARAGRRTLLLDGDLRSPAVHQLFELPMQPGFSEALLGEIGVDDVLQETPIDGLWVIAAGQWDREVVQALAKEGVQSLFERFKEQFDFVVVDSHPVLAAADSLLLGQHADAVLLSLLRDVSQAPRVYAAGQRLTNLGVRVLGAVVSGMPQEDLYNNAFQAPAQATA
jgi:polysaccharide biosynthesis transport protein